MFAHAEKVNYLRIQKSRLIELCPAFENKGLILSREVNCTEMQLSMIKKNFFLNLYSNRFMMTHGFVMLPTLLL